MRVLVDTLLDKRYTDDSTADEYLRMIANENKRLTHLIDSFLTFSRMERNKQVFDFQSASPADIASGAVEAIRTKLSNHTCDFAVRLDENLPAVYADRDAMITVLVNLLDNACKYGKEDKRIQLRVYAENASVCFAVKDNGIGISKRQQKKIFGRFYQADSRLSRSVEGCGLGLSIVKFIVDAHKGTIDVDSKVGEGSTFTVRVPQV
jgi:signal transduction histidine kinase